MRSLLLIVIAILSITLGSMRPGIVIKATDQNGEVSADILRRALIAQQPSTIKHSNEIEISQVFTDSEALKYQAYSARKRYKTVRYPSAASMRAVWTKVSYVVLERRHRVLMLFDDRYYFGMAGNSTSFGLVSLLGENSKQLIVSQDVNRGGAQWIANLSQSPRLIFSGPDWAVGREAYDLGIVDLDNDGVYEVTVPITDFYDLQDKMSMSQIPLPEIVFKYDRHVRKYLPANPVFSGSLLKDEGALDEDVSGNDPSALRAAVLHTLLAYIYAGKQKDAWDFYDRSYTLSDKEEVRRRLKAILIRQPVYKFIYNRRKNK